MPVWLPLLPVPSPPPVRDESFRLPNGIVLREERTRGEIQGFRLVVRGRRTGVVFGPELARSPEPVVAVWRTSRGIVYGTLFRIQSGARSVGGTIAFIDDRGRGYLRFASAAIGRGPRVLLVGNGGEEDDPLVGYPVLYEARRFREVGPATKVHLESSGRVTGWYLARADDRPFEGSIENAPPLFRRYFVWKDGKRFLKGREPDR